MHFQNLPFQVNIQYRHFLIQHNRIVQSCVNGHHSQSDVHSGTISTPACC